MLVLVLLWLELKSRINFISHKLLDWKEQGDL